ncbi:hypothetical protein H6F43_03980 [Leptolyngbya sp. FACHB-36]|nr:hypothetical protein [Leptolyngbya sp. FACHB-36]
MQTKKYKPTIITLYAGTAGTPSNNAPTAYALWVPGVGPLRLVSGDVSDQGANSNDS